MDRRPADTAPALADPHPRPLRELLEVAGPTMVQMVGFTAMQFTDTWMIAVYGARRGSVLEPTAATNAGLAAFAAVCVGVGTVTIVNALASQAYGAGRHRRCGRFLWQGVWFSLFFGVAILAVLPLAGPYFRLAGHAPEMVALEVPYFDILLYATVIRLLGGAGAQFLIAVNRAVWAMLATLAGIAVNVVGNYALIFGELGFREMGLRGAAWATNVGAAVELLVLVAVIASPAMRRFGTSDWKFRRPAMAKLLKVGLPSGLQFTADVWPWTIFLTVIMARFGEATMAANAFMFRYMTTSFLPAIGISIAVTALVGRYVGARRPDVAAARAHMGFRLVMLWLAVCGVAYLFFGRPLLSIFTDDPEVLRLGVVLLAVAAFYQFFDALYITYAHALRGAGDTLVPALVTGALCWGLLIGGGYLAAALVPSAGTFGPWAIACVYGVTLGIFMFARFRRRRWARGVPAALAGPGA